MLPFFRQLFAGIHQESAVMPSQSSIWYQILSFEMSSILSMFGIFCHTACHLITSQHRLSVRSVNAKDCRLYS